MMRTRFVVSALALVAVAACRGSGGDDDVTVDAPVAGEMTVQQVQDDATMVGTPVTLKGVVVIAVDRYGVRNGDFYVMEPEGGPFSGIQVHNGPLGTVNDLAVGDLVDIGSAEKDEFSLSDDDATVTELVPLAGGTMTVTKTGTAPVPAPHMIDALAVGQMAKAAREAEYEKWESVLVQVNSVSVNSELRTIGTTDPLFRGFSITGLLEVDSSLTEIPTMPTNLVTGGDCLASVSGVGSYFYEYKVLPRATADIVKNGTGCPAREMGDQACADTIDNDANGFIDCLDNGCRSLSACSPTTTVAMVQGGTATGNVTLNDVVVTAVNSAGASSSRGIWVADAAQAAANNGVFVYTGTAAPAGVSIGSIVDVTGMVQEFDVAPMTGDKLTEIGFSTVTLQAGTATPVPLSGVAINTLTDIVPATNAGEPYEGVLVTLSNVKVTAAPGNDRLTVTAGGSSIVLDDDAYDYAAATYPVNTTCFASVTGVMTVNVFDNERRLLPRKVEDLVTTGGNCP